MKVKEQQRARTLRARGRSIRHIAKELKVSKGSVSLWVRDIVLTPQQNVQLIKNGFSNVAIEKRRVSRIRNTKRKHEAIVAEAYQKADEFFSNPLWVLGVGLYWGEGGKAGSIVRVSNSDPDVIKVMMRFFREVCCIPEEKFHGHIHTFAYADISLTEEYWSRISGIPISRFFKTYTKPSAAGKQKRKTLPYGTFQIYVHDTVFFFTLLGWMKRLRDFR